MLCDAVGTKYTRRLSTASVKPRASLTNQHSRRQSAESNQDIESLDDYDVDEVLGMLAEEPRRNSVPSLPSINKPDSPTGGALKIDLSANTKYLKSPNKSPEPAPVPKPAQAAPPKPAEKILDINDLDIEEDIEEEIEDANSISSIEVDSDVDEKPKKSNKMNDDDTYGYEDDFNSGW